MSGTSGNDNMQALAGNDTLNGGLGNDELGGGDGWDMAIFRGLRSAYSIVRNGDSALVTGPDGRVSLVGVERLQFNDSLAWLRQRLKRQRVPRSPPAMMRPQ